MIIVQVKEGENIEKTEETDMCKKNVVFFPGVCINMCSTPVCSAGGSNSDR